MTLTTTRYTSPNIMGTILPSPSRTCDPSIPVESMTLLPGRASVGRSGRWVRGVVVPLPPFVVRGRTPSPRVDLRIGCLQRWASAGRNTGRTPGFETPHALVAHTPAALRATGPSCGSHPPRSEPHRPLCLTGDRVHIGGQWLTSCCDAPAPVRGCREIATRASTRRRLRCPGHDRRSPVSDLGSRPPDSSLTRT